MIFVFQACATIFRRSLIVCLFLTICYADLSYAGDEVVIREGPELEVQKEFAQNLLDEVDWNLFYQRWNFFLDILSSYGQHPGALARFQHQVVLKPWEEIEEKRTSVGLRRRLFDGLLEWESFRGEILSKLAEKVKNALPSYAIDETSSDGIVTSLRKLSGLLRNHPNLALEITSSLSSFPEKSLTGLPEDREFLSQVKNLKDDGFYTLRGDTNGSYRLTRDSDVFELIHYPPFEKAELADWIQEIRRRLGISENAIPARTLNPHFHFSRDLPGIVDESQIRSLVHSLRVLTAIVTIEEAESEGLMKSPRPFYGGMNSANYEWFSWNKGPPDVSYRGNVRMIYEKPKGAITELRFEIRSLGNLSWLKIMSYRDEIKNALKGDSLSDIHANVKKLIAEKFSKLDSLKFAQAVKDSRIKASKDSLSESKHRPKYHSIVEYLKYFELEIRESLINSYGLIKADELLAQKFSLVRNILEVDERAAICEAMITGNNELFLQFLQLLPGSVPALHE